MPGIGGAHWGRRYNATLENRAADSEQSPEVRFALARRQPRRTGRPQRRPQRAALRRRAGL